MSNNHKSQSNGNNRRGHRESKDFSQSKPVKVSDMALRLVPLGGLDEFGKNMWAIEQGDDIILADMGLQMPGADQPGVDFIVPNATYLREKASQVRGLFLTNGHYSSIGAVPYILHLFPGIDIFATEATFATLESRRSFYSQNMKYRKHIVDEGSSIRLGSIKVDVFKLNFNFPGNIGLCFYTLQGKVIYAPSFKFDYDQANEKMVDLGHIASLTEGGVFALLVGATGAEAEGYAPSEASIGRDIDKIIGNAKGRVFFSTFSSMLTRMQQIVDAVEKHDKKLYIEGKSILNTFNTSRKRGLIRLNRGTIVGPDQINKIPRDKTVIICVGAQGDDVPQLMRIVNKEHPMFRIEEGDGVAFASSLIPGNERSVQKVKDNLAKQGAIIHHLKYLDIFYGANARTEDLKVLLSIVRPQYVIPVNGPHYLLRRVANIADMVGFPEKNVVVTKNGFVQVFDHKQRIRTKEKVPAHPVMVDGLGVGDLKDVVIRDRQVMSDDGIFNIIILIDKSGHKLVQEPDLISKGFVNEDQSKRLMEDTNQFIKTLVEALITSDKGGEINASYIRDELRDQVGKFLFARTERRPMVLPVVVMI